MDCPDGAFLIQLNAVSYFSLVSCLRAYQDEIVKHATAKLNKQAADDVPLWDDTGLPIATAGDKWRDEWEEISETIRHAVEYFGISLSPEEYNAAMFNDGRYFQTKRDAIQALLKALSKAADA